MWRMLAALAAIAGACGGAQRADGGDRDRRALLAAIEAEMVTTNTCASIAHDDLAYLCERIRASAGVCVAAKLDGCYEPAALIAEALRTANWHTHIADIAERERARERERETQPSPSAIDALTR